MNIIIIRGINLRGANEPHEKNSYFYDATFKVPSWRASRRSVASESHPELEAEPVPRPPLHRENATGTLRSRLLEISKFLVPAGLPEPTAS